jgi:hypothetical protein
MAMAPPESFSVLTSNPKVAQHIFGVIARGCGFDDGCNAACVEAGEDDR